MSERIRPVSIVFIFFSLVFQGAAVVLGKTAALRMESQTAAAFLSNIWYLGAVSCLLFQAFFWQLVLREVRLFVAYLFTSLNYFVVLGASRLFFHERVTGFNIVGAAVIVAGVYVVVREDLA
jgi:drug/metabolite transporter (DMT)-like permease